MDKMTSLLRAHYTVYRLYQRIGDDLLNRLDSPDFYPEEYVIGRVQEMHAAYLESMQLHREAFYV